MQMLTANGPLSEAELYVTFDLFFLVRRTRNTARTHVSYSSLVGDGTIVLCGKVGEEWKLTQYDLQKGVELSSAFLGELPWGMACVTLNGQPCLAMSYM